MKHMKKFVSLVLALVMVMAMSLTAMAGTITIDQSNGTATDYKAYQIFTGDLATVDGEQVLSNIEWGSDIDGDKLLKALQEDEETAATFASCTDAKSVAAQLSGLGENAPLAKKFADIAGTCKKGAGTAATDNVITVPAGYYLVEGKTETANGSFFTRNILEIVGEVDVPVSPKGEVPSVEKKVHEDTADADTWQDVADYDIGDDVPFQLTGTLPSNYEDYDSYKYVFHDTLSAGLALNETSIVVTVDGTPLTKGTDYQVQAGTETEGAKCSFEIVISDLKKAALSATAGSKVVVTYTAKLGDGATIGGTGNPNEVRLEYSNNPNAGGEGDTGTTPPDKVVVFTFTVNVNKVESAATDENPNATKALAGAGFTLEKWNGSTWEEVEVLASGDAVGDGNNEFNFKGEDAGFYKLTESTVPDGFNKCDDIYFKVEATYKDGEEVPTLDNLDVYQTNEKGEKLEGANVTAEFSVVVPDGTASTDILNQRGSVLPSTGGIGTTIFYVVGGLLVVGAAVLLIAKKRAKHEA